MHANLREDLPLNWRTEVDRDSRGKAFAELLPPPFKVEVIYKEECINKLAENTAVNRGARFMVCGSESKALQWLLDC